RSTRPAGTGLRAGARGTTSLAACSGPGRWRPILGGRRFPDKVAELGRKALTQLLQQPVLGLLVLLAGRLDLAALEQQTDETLMALFIHRIGRHGSPGPLQRPGQIALLLQQP